MKRMNTLLFAALLYLVSSCGNTNSDDKSSNPYPTVQNADTATRSDSNTKNRTNGYAPPGTPGTGETAAGSKDSMQ